MKQKLTIYLFLISVVFISCNEENNTKGFELVTVAKAKYMTLDALRSSISIVAPIDIVESGKIYAYNNLVLVNDVDKGIHIIDNSNPENPTQIAFINIIANKDMEIKGNYLYADSLMDLVVFDISDINNITEITRLEDVLQSYVPMPFFDDGVVLYDNDDYLANSIVVGWTVSEELKPKGEVEIIRNQGGITGGGMFDFALASAVESIGQGGSLARFKIVSDYLYAVDSHNINVFKIDNLESPEKLETVFAGYDIETIFNRGDQLFLGSMSGMYVYDITKPASPKYISEFQHGTACDPVVVDDTYAYVTLRAGNNCGAFDSSLEIIDITDIYNLELVKSYTMDNPYGLGIKDDLLFICDGNSGLKVYDKKNVEELVLLNTFETVTAFDVIPMSNKLLMIGDNTLFQYKYSDEGLTLLSQFSLGE